MNRVKPARPFKLTLSINLALVAMLVFSGCGQRPMDMHFSIKPLSVAGRKLSVSLKIDNAFRDKRPLKLYKGAVDLSEFSVQDDQGRKPGWRDSSGFIIIDPSGRGNARVNIAYTVTINRFGRHGHQGGVYPDMVVFDGEHVLILPEVLIGASDSAMHAQVGAITIDYGFSGNWTAIVPFTSGRATTTVDSLTWLRVYDLVKSCFAFGRFDEHRCGEPKAGFTIAGDTLCRASYTNDARTGIEALYAYYAKLFGTALPDYSIVLLRKDPDDMIKLMGGLGVQNMGSSFDPALKSDWRYLSHRMFHSFFDFRIAKSMFHKEPQLWFLEGLACYYEIAALESLPGNIRKQLRFDVDNEFAGLARRYAYMRSKDKRFAIAPMQVASLKSGAEIEFLHYTQAPLLVKFIEDQGRAAFSGKDRIMNFILENRENINSLEPIVSFALGEHRDEYTKKYLFGSDSLPLSYPLPAPADSAAAAGELDAFERILSSLASPADTASIRGKDNDARAREPENE